MSSHCLFCLTSLLSHKTGKHNILTIEELELGIIWHLVLELNNQLSEELLIHFLSVSAYKSVLIVSVYSPPVVLFALLPPLDLANT